MQDIVHNSKFGELPLWKKVGIIVGAILIVSAVLTLLKMMLFSYGARSITSNFGAQSDSAGMMAPAVQNEMALDSRGAIAKNDMARSYAPQPGRSIGADAEEYEALRYKAAIKGKEIESTCDAIEELKPLQYVVFENAQRRDGYCSYRFKVKRSQVDSIVTKVNALNPYDFTSNTQTRKNQVTQFEGRLDILLQQQELYRSYLQNVNQEYERAISATADIPNAEALAQLLRDRQDLVERINRDRINVASQLQTISQGGAEIFDSIEYVDFTVSVYKYEIFNAQDIKDSWMRALGDLVTTANNVFQYLTVGLIQLALFLVLALVYAAIIFFVVVFVVRAAIDVVKSIWKKKEVRHEEHHEEHTHNT